LLKELFFGWRGLLSLSASILSANLRAIPLRTRYFIFPKSRAASLATRKNDRIFLEENPAETAI